MGYFIYARKSQEDNARQVQSIGDQLKFAWERAAGSGLNITGVFEEARSARRPGRPLFNEMVARIEAGEADGIVSWHPDRLSRNAVDSGVIMDLLDRGKLRDLKFHSDSFQNTPEGKWMLSIVLGQGKYFVDKLSVDVQRGYQSKLDKGHSPQVAPPGYRNNRDERTIEADPERFEMVQRAMRLVLTGAYSASQVLQILNDEWGFRTLRRPNSGGGPLKRSVFYKMLSNVFYTGLIRNGGQIYPGKHPPMLTQQEFEEMQRILGKREIISQKAEFDFTGLIRCGLCGYQITAETKRKHYKSTGRTVSYTYYHCTNGRGGCTIRSVTHEAIEARIKGLLSSVRLNARVAQWCLKPAEDYFIQTAGFEHDAIESLQKSLSLAQRKKSNLIQTQLSDPDSFSIVEFKQEKQKLDDEISRLQREVRTAGERLDAVRQTVENVFDFAVHAADSFERGDTKMRKEIAARLGLKYVLTLGKLEIEPHPLLMPILRIEPLKSSSSNKKDEPNDEVRLSWCRARDDIRNLALKDGHYFPKMDWPVEADNHLLHLPG